MFVFMSVKKEKNQQKTPMQQYKWAVTYWTPCQGHFLSILYQNIPILSKWKDTVKDFMCKGENIAFFFLKKQYQMRTA